MAQKEAAITWLWFSFILGFLPILFAFLSRALVSADAHPVRHGDLYLIAATLSFTGVGSMFRAGIPDQRRLMFLMIAGGTALGGVLDALLYAVVSANPHPHSMWVNTTSGILYVVSALCSLACTVSAGG